MLAVIIFVLSTAAASGVLFVLWQDSGRSVTALQQTLQGNPGVRHSTAPTNARDPLQPVLILTDDLTDQREELEKQLRTPLRRYYATKTEQLGDIRVQRADDDKHTASVTLTVTDGATMNEYTFFYDRTGKDREGPYPTWEPSLLDNTD